MLETSVVLLLHRELDDKARDDVDAVLDDAVCALEALDLPLVTFNAVSELDLTSLFFDWLTFLSMTGFEFFVT